jgi:hypothetical protein
MVPDTTKYGGPEERGRFLDWLRENYQEAKSTGVTLFCWFLDRSRGEDTCLSISGYTLVQVREDSKQKKLALTPLRCFRTDRPFEDQVKDL